MISLGLLNSWQGWWWIEYDYRNSTTDIRFYLI